MRRVVVCAVGVFALLSCTGMASAQGNSWERDYEKKQKAARDSLEAFAERVCRVVGQSSTGTTTEILGEMLDDEIDDLNEGRPQSGLKRISNVSTTEYVGASRERLEGLALDQPRCRSEVMHDWRDRLLLPDLVTVQIRPQGNFIDNLRFGPIDRDISTLYLSIDGRRVAGGYLNTPFRYVFRTIPGQHQYEFQADIMGPGMMLNMVEGTCSGAVDISDHATLRPAVEFEMIGLDGYFSDCSLD